MTFSYPLYLHTNIYIFLTGLAVNVFKNVSLIADIFCFGFAFHTHSLKTLNDEENKTKLNIIFGTINRLRLEQGITPGFFIGMLSS